MSAYYNEIDPFKAEVLREAIKAGAIAPGEVDERSIADVRPGELVRFTQCHFFAGGGFWSLALRQAGWPDDRPVWTGSCPCPSFSAAGKGEGFTDPRHLWPEWFRLVRECRPAVVFGEQVSAAIGHGWLDLVSTDLESEGYAFAAAVLGAHSVGAPHMRQRLYFVAERGVGLDHPASPRRDGPQQGAEGTPRDEARMRGPGERCGLGLLVNPSGGGLGIAGSAPGGAGHADLAGESQHLGEPKCSRLEGLAGDGGDGDQSGRERENKTRSVAEAGGACRLADTDGGEPCDRGLQRSGKQREQPQNGSDVSVARGPVNGFWRSADWVLTRPQRMGDRPGLRPVERGTFPLAHGSPARVGRLRLYGDAIVVPAAQAFIEAYI